MATETTTDNAGNGQVDLKAFCRWMDSNYAQILDQNMAIEALVEIIDKTEDVHPGICIMLRNIRQNISAHLEELDDANTRLRTSLGMKTPWEVTA